MKITDDLVRRFLYDEIKLEDPYQEESEEIDEQFLEVFGSEYPEYMDFQRPNESESQKAYRKAYFESIGNPVSGFLGLIEKQIDKVFTSDDFKIRFNHKSKLPREQDTAQWYFTKGYYNGADLLKAFSESIKKDTLLKPNSLMVLFPNEGEDGYPRPYYLIVDSENVLYFKANEFALVKSEMKSDVKNYDGRILENYGDIFYFFDSEKYCIATHVAFNDSGQKVFETNQAANGEFLNHGCDFLPAKKIGRRVVKQTQDGHELRTSDLTDSLVFLREAQMNHGDLTVEHNFHVASQEWVLGTVECSTCKGMGKVRGKGVSESCPTCSGSKTTPVYTGSGLNKMVIPMDLNSLGRSEKMPTEFGGFITRPETGVRVFSEAYEKNIKLALRPFGLENAILTPYNQSGDAKSYDMQEGYAFITSMASHVEDLINFLINGIVSIRYKSLPSERRALEYPSITVPKRFNLSSAESLYNKLKDASNQGLPDFMKLKYMKQLVEKENGLNSEEYLFVKAKEDFDPFPTYTLQQKISVRDVVSDLKYILTINIDSILKELIQEDKEFLIREYKVQKELVYKKAEDYLLQAESNLKQDVSSQKLPNIATDNQNNL